jgi:benzodiazapine receptor
LNAQPIRLAKKATTVRRDKYTCPYVQPGPTVQPGTLKGATWIMDTKLWYAQLEKPAWAPPAWLFGPVWSLLYVIIAISFGYVFWLAFTGAVSAWLAAAFVLNLVFNAAFTPLQFGLRSNVLAALDIVLVLVTLIWALLAIYPLEPWVVYANIPYLIWVIFATVLQFAIVRLNR